MANPSTSTGPVATQAPAVSVVVPVREEAENVVPLLAEIEQALAGETAEILFVDDGSRDATASVLAGARAAHPRLRLLRHTASCGQSRAIRTGLLAARGRLVVTLDGDGQNDPADIPALLAAFRAAADAGERIGMVGGLRQRRQDVWLKRFSSRVANAANRWLLRHDCRDVGCGLKVVDRSLFLRLPYFDHMHRFLPALVRREGFAARYLPVNHRPREHGRSKYGTLDRLAAGMVDLLGVRWLLRRSQLPEIIEEDRPCSPKR